MTIIPFQLQQRRPQIPQTLSEYQLSKLPQTPITVDTTLQNRYEEARQKIEGIRSYEDYFSAYSNLPSDLKQYFTSPSEIKKTSDYQTYESQKTSYETAQRDYSDYMAGYTRASIGGIVAGKVSSAFMEGFRAGKLELHGQLAENRYGQTVKQAEAKFQKIQSELTASGIKAEPWVAGVVSNPYQSSITGAPVGTYVGAENIYKAIAEQKAKEINISKIGTFGFSGESYQPGSNMFVAESPTGRQGTAYLRIPSPSEQEKFRFIKERGTLLPTSTYEERYAETTGIRKNFWDFREKAQTTLENIGERVSAWTTPKERRLEEQTLEEQGNNLNFLISDFQNRYQNPPLHEGTPERIAYEQELNEINFQIEAYNQRLNNYSSKIQQEQEKPLINVGNVGLLGGGAEFGRSFMKGAVEFPFKLASFGVGLATAPKEEAISLLTGLKQLPSQFEQYPVTTTGYLTGQLAMSKLMGWGYRKVMTPKFSTQIIGTSKPTETGAVTDVFFKTTESRIGGLLKKDYFGKARAISETGELEGISWAKTLTGGQYAQIGRDLITGTEKAGTIKKFGAVDISLTKQIGTTPPIYYGGSVGKSATIKGSEYYGSMGLGINAGKITQIGGKTITETGGRGSYFGFIVESVPKEEVGIMGFRGTGKSSPAFFKQLYGNIVSQATAPIIKTAPKTPAITLPSMKQPSLIESFYPTYVGGTKLKEESFGFGITGGVIEGEDSFSSVLTGEKTKFGFKTGLGLGVNLGYEQKTRTIAVEQLKQPQITFSSLLTPQATETQQKTRQLFGQPVKEAQVQRERLIQKGVQQQPPTTPKITQTPASFGFIFGGKEEKTKEPAYFGYAKVGERWKKVTPLSTKVGAVDLASQFVDRNLSRQFKVLKATKNVEGKKQFIETEMGKLFQGNNYWNRNKFKFRTFQQKKGVRTQIPSGAIEKSKYSMDYEVPKFKQARQEARVSNLFFGNKKQKGGFKI